MVDAGTVRVTLPTLPFMGHHAPSLEPQTWTPTQSA